MDKTININLAGSMFTIDEDAYRILRDYLQALDLRFRNVKGGNETIDDIESRIAEIFHSQRGNAGIITRENVESMISTLGKPEEFDAYDTQEEAADNTFRKKRLYRNPDDTIIAGVCGGLGAYLNTDPVLLRILFVFFTAFFAIGFFVYLVLWIALPSATSDNQKREMYGNEYARVMAFQRQANGGKKSSPSYNKGYYDTSRIGNAINEIFRAAGNILFIILRVVLVVIGIVFLLTGFLFLLTFVVVFVFKIPGAFSSDAFDFNIAYMPDFLNYIVSPELYPWILSLTIIAVILPLAALIYWGVKMIIWFRANDGLLSLSLLIIWVLSLTSLAILLFNEGVSFAESSRSTVRTPLNSVQDTVYVFTNNNVTDLLNAKTLPVSTEDYNLLIDDERKELYIQPDLGIKVSSENPVEISVRKESFGSTEIVAFKRSKEIIYNYNADNDTIMLDSYFTLPRGRKWSGDNIRIRIYLPEGTVVKTDSGTEKMLDLRRWDNEEENHYPLEKREGFSYWKLSEDGLEPADL